MEAGPRPGEARIARADEHFTFARTSFRSALDETLIFLIRQMRRHPHGFTEQDTVNAGVPLVTELYRQRLFVQLYILVKRRAEGRKGEGVAGWKGGHHNSG